MVKLANEKLLDALYDKMSAEQERYRRRLMEQPPGEILNHAYEYSIREDIMMEMEAPDLTDAQARALLKSRTPLADVYELWSNSDTHHMDGIREAIENRADDVIHAEKEKGQREAR